MDRKEKDKMFNDLYNRLNKPIKSRTMHLNGIEQYDIESLNQEIWLQVFLALDTYEEQGMLDSWCWKVAERRIFMFLKEENKRLKYEKNFEDMSNISKEEEAEIEVACKYSEDEINFWKNKIFKCFSNPSEELMITTRNLYGDWRDPTIDSVSVFLNVKKQMVQDILKKIRKEYK